MANPRSFSGQSDASCCDAHGVRRGWGGEWSVAAVRGWVVEIENRVKLFFLRFRVRWPKSHAYLGFRQPNISNFYGFSWWFFPGGCHLWNPRGGTRLVYQSGWPSITIFSWPSITVFFQLCMNLGKRFTIEFLGVPSFRQSQIGWDS